MQKLFNLCALLTTAEMASADETGGSSTCDSCPDLMGSTWGYYDAGTKEKGWATAFQERLLSLALDIGDVELQNLVDPSKTTYYRCAASDQCEAARQAVIDKLEGVRCVWEDPGGGMDATLTDPYLLRGAFTCEPAKTESDGPYVIVLLAVVGWLSFCVLACFCGCRSPIDVVKGQLKALKNCKRACKKAVDYEVHDDDEAFFDARGYNMRKPARKDSSGKLIGRENPAKTNMYKYMVWRRRSLYAVLLPSIAVFLDGAIACWPALEEIAEYETLCKPGQSLLSCGGPGKLARFLTAAGGATNLKIVLILISVFAAAAQGFQCLAIRIASSRSGDWLRSSRWLILSWMVPFAWFYIVYAFPLTQVYDINWTERAGSVVMMPFLSSKTGSPKFDMCSVVNLCGGRADIPIFIAEAFFVELLNEELGESYTAAQWKKMLEDHWKEIGLETLAETPGGSFTQYKSQTAPGFPDGVRLSDSGDFMVQDMMDVLDYLFVVFIGTPPGIISETAKPLISNFVVSLNAIVRSDVTFKCLLTLAPLAMSILPALMKGSIAAKLVLPQDPVIGWLTRGIPLLTVPLHAVFILAVGQMFADWWVCMGCVCFMIGDGAVTYFGSAIPAAYATFHAPMKFVKKAKLKGTLCMLLGVIFMFMGLTTNDLISTSMPEVSFNVDVNVSSLLHTVIIFVAKFMISKNLMTIIFSDCVISLVFSINTELQNQDLQRPYQHEVAEARLYMNRRWLKGEPKPSGCIGDLFGKDSTPGPTDEKADFVGKLAKCKADVKKADLLFDELDADKSGTVDENELRQLIVKLGRKASDEEAKKMMSYMDADGQGTVDKSEFLTYFEQLDELFVIHSDGTKNYVDMPAQFSMDKATRLPRDTIDKFPAREPFALTGEASYRACIQPPYDSDGASKDEEKGEELMPDSHP